MLGQASDHQFFMYIFINPHSSLLGLCFFISGIKKGEAPGSLNGSPLVTYMASGRVWIPAQIQLAAKKNG